MIKENLSLSLLLLILIGAVLSTTLSLDPITVKAQTTTLEVLFPNMTWESVDEFAAGDSFSVRINVGEVSDLAGVEFKLWYKPAVLTATNAILFGLFTGGNLWLKEINETRGYVWFIATKEPGVTGPGSIAAIQFTADAPGGGSCLYLEDTKLSDSEAQPIPHEVHDGHFETASVYVHDIGITKVTPSSSKVIQGEAVNVTVVARNHGYYSESFSVTVYANGTAVGTPNTPVTDLPPGYLTILTFTWDTSGFALGKYIMSANATTVPEEIDTTDNSRAMTLDFSSGPSKPHPFVYITIFIVKLPVAAFDYSPKLPYVKQPVAFNASESRPNGGAIETYQWDFGDGNFTAESFSFRLCNNTFAFSGTYNVTLTVRDSEGLAAKTWKLITIYTRDIALVNVTAYPTVQYKPNPVFINVTVLNKGQLSETFDVGVYYDGGSAGNPQTVTDLEAGASKNLTFIWDTTFVPATRAGTTYQISANATRLRYEANASNNIFIDGFVTIIKQQGPVANFTYSPKTPIENEVVDFNASLSGVDPNTNAPIISYYWDYGDGVKEIYTGANITHFSTHSYSVVGSYVVKLNVTDDQGFSDAVEATITVYKHDIAVISVARYKTKVVVGENVEIDVTVRNKGDFPETFNINVYANTTIIQTKPTTLQSGKSSVEVFIWDTTGFPLGTYTIKAEVPQITGETYTADNTLTDGTVLVVKRPIASFNYSPSSPAIGDVVTFDASASTPNGGAIQSYTWNFGDGNITTVTHPSITHIYATPETYTVTLNITDTEEVWNTASRLITINKMLGTIAIATSPSTIRFGESTTISGSITPARPSVDVKILQRKSGTQAWNTIATVQTNLASTYSYTWTPTTHGAYELKANWTGDANTLQAESEVEQLLVKAFPVASFTCTPTPSVVGDTMTFTSTSTDPDGSVTAWDWDFGDGAHGNSENVTHMYATAGDFTVTLTVTDNDGLTNTKSNTIAVKEAANFPFYLIVGAVIVAIVVIGVIAYVLIRKRH